MATLRKEFLSFTKAKEFVRLANVSSRLDYEARYKQISSKLPYHPQYIYPAWKGWNDFLNVKRKPGGRRRIDFLSFEEAQELASKYGLKTSAEYYKKYKEISDRLPCNPHHFYSEFKSWGGFLRKKSKKKKRGEMKNKFSFTIEGEPESWYRPGVNRNGFHMYDRNKHYKKHVWSTLKEHEKDNHQNPDVYESAIKIKMAFFMSLPKRKGKNNPVAGDFCTRAPDVDNLVKLVLDIFTKHIIYDDRQVVELTANKVYSDEPRTEVEYEVVGEKLTKTRSNTKLHRQNKILKFKKPSYATAALFD